MDRELSSVLSFMGAKGCHVNQTWLTDCVNFFRSENPQYTLRDLEAFTYDQWLLADLRDMGGVASLPPNLSDQLNVPLNGRMACQVEYLTDIGHSSYTQMQKIRDEDVGNLNITDETKEFQQAWEPKSNRMLSLSICDGVQTIRAIEYKPIPKLSTDLIPGTKVLIVGPVQCRRGVLLLEDKNLVILGGEVDALVISNAYENILARKLHLPENPNPYKPINRPEAINNAQQAQQALPVAPDRLLAPQQPVPRAAAPQPSIATRPATHQQPTVTRPPIHQQPTVTRPTIHQLPASASNKKLIQPTLSWGKPTVKSISHNQPAKHGSLSVPMNNHHLMDVDIGDWEEGDLDQEIASLGDSKNQPHFSASNQHTITNNSRTSANAVENEFEMGSDDEDLFLRAEENLLQSKATETAASTRHAHRPGPVQVTSRLPNTSNSMTISNASVACKRQAPDDLRICLKKPLFSTLSKQETSSQEVSSTSDVRNNFDLWEDDCFGIEDSVLQPAGIKESEHPKSVSSSPYVYIAQIQNFKSNLRVVFRVKAVVVTVVDKLKIINAEWQLTVTITDGSANLNVKFLPKVLDEIIGMTASEMQLMKKEMTENPSRKDDLRKKLAQAQKYLISLNSLMDIEISTESDSPTVVGLENLSSQAVSALKLRCLDAT